MNRSGWLGYDRVFLDGTLDNALKKRVFVCLVTAHLLLSAGSFLVLQGLGVALQDAGMTSRVLAWLEILVQFFLLQPLAHWVLGGVEIAWWTWPGLLLTILLLALNSLAVGALLAGSLALFQRGRSAGRLPGD